MSRSLSEMLSAQCDLKSKLSCSKFVMDLNSFNPHQVDKPVSPVRQSSGNGAMNNPPFPKMP